MGELERVGPPADVWSLGVLLYEGLTGKVPFCRKILGVLVHQITHSDPSPPRTIDRGIDRSLEAICLRALEKEPGRRYPDGTAFAADLARWRRGEAVVAAPSGFGMVYRRHLRRHRTLVSSVVITVLVTTLGVGWWFRPGDDPVPEDGGEVSESVPASHPPDKRSSSRATRVELLGRVGQAQREADAGRLARAEELLGQVLETDPDLLEAFLQRALVREKLGNVTGAMSDYREAERVRPDQIDIYVNRGNLFRRVGYTKEALRDLNKALALDAQRVEAYNNRALVYLASGRLDSAMADLNRAIEIDPENPVLYKGRGDVKARMGQYEAACSDYDQAVLGNPRYANAFNARGLAWVERGEETRALADYDEAIRIDSANWLPHFNRALLFHGRGEFEEAVFGFDRVLSLQPKYASAYYLRGDSYRRLGRHTRAWQSWKEYLQLRPDAPKRSAIEDYFRSRGR